MGSEPGGGGAPAPPPVVVLDANLLHPFHLRNLLIQLGVDAVIAPRWTARIHEEWIANLAATGRVHRERLARTRDLMDRVLPDAEVPGWEPLVANLVLPDPDNRRDFPPAALAPQGVLAAHPDPFLCALYDADPEVMRAWPRPRTPTSAGARPISAPSSTRPNGRACPAPSGSCARGGARADAERAYHLRPRRPRVLLRDDRHVAGDAGLRRSQTDCLGTPIRRRCGGA